MPRCFQLYHRPVPVINSRLAPDCLDQLLDHLQLDHYSLLHAELLEASLNQVQSIFAEQTWQLRLQEQKELLLLLHQKEERIDQAIETQDYSQGLTLV